LYFGKPTLEVQFVEVLKKKKIAKLESPEHVARRDKLSSCDFVLSISMVDITPKIGGASK